MTSGLLALGQAVAPLYSCSCCNDLPLKVSFMIQENIRHGSLPGDQSLPSRQLNECTKVEHKNNELAGFCPFHVMCQSTISGTGEDNSYVKHHSVPKNNFFPFTVKETMFLPSAKVKEGHGNSWAFDMEIIFSLKVKARGLQRWQ